MIRNTPSRSLLHGRGYPRVLYGNSVVHNVSNMTTHGSAPSFTMKLSPDGNFLATGDKDGTLEIRVRETGSWRWICLYSTGGAICSLVWHPAQTGTIFSGSANGVVHKVTVVLGGNNLFCDDSVPGYIHFLQLSPDGRKLVVAYGRMISIVNNPFPQCDYIGTLINLDIPFPDNVRIFTDYNIPCGIFFPPGFPDDVVIAFLGKRGIKAYSIRDGTQSWSIPLCSQSFVGSSAMSLSGERIAVMNLRDGIDFYSTSRRQFLSTTKYEMTCQDPPQNLLVDILFVDDETVAFGHSDGMIGFATFGLEQVDTFFETGHDPSVPIRSITFGFVDNKPLIFGLTAPLPSRSSARFPSDIYIGRIETPGLMITDQPDHDEYDSDERARHPSSRLGSKLSTATIISIIAATFLSTLWGQSMLSADEPVDHSAPIYTRVPNIDPPDHGCDRFIRITTSTMASDPLSTCICTITGTFNAVKESGINQD